MSESTLRMLTRYNRWANRLIFDAVAALPDGESLKPRQTVFGNIVHTLSHSYVVGAIFQAHLEGREHGFSSRNFSEPMPLAQLKTMQEKIDDWYIAYSNALTPQDEEELVPFKFIGGGEGAMTRSEMVLHVVNHTTYHRGFIADMFCQIPLKAPVTDLPVYLREQRAARALSS
ncbi:DinB family protein [Paraburkholderia sp. BCC1885]|uniref:DinB family protein n=1 Tax=Paraburkholderia sp. BCC1885 TaxID=2562669 RepID=UPI0011833EB1|nr:DinB family protein [Paraburkholderia sp. BCC1885]